MPQPQELQEIEVRYTYRIERGWNGVYAECVETSAMGEGATREAAIESLRDALLERLGSPDAVAPPSVPEKHKVVLVEADPRPRSGKTDL